MTIRSPSALILLSKSGSPCYSAPYAPTGPTGLKNIARGAVSFLVNPPNNRQINALLHKIHHRLQCGLLHNHPHPSLRCRLLHSPHHLRHHPHHNPVGKTSPLIHQLLHASWSTRPAQLSLLVTHLRFPLLLRLII